MSPKLSMASQRLEGLKMLQILTKAKELERQGKTIIHFEIGDPDFGTPKNIVNMACDSLKRGETHYVPSSGILELKVAAAEVTEKRSRGFRPDLNQILVTPGTTPQVDYAVTNVADPGDEIIIPDPGYILYSSIIKFRGMKPIPVPLREENNFRMNPEDIKKLITDKTKMIIINSPSNPTGAVMTEGDIREIYEIAEQNDLFLLSDEIYARMIYSDSKTNFFSPSMLDKCKERTILVNGFSKSYAMTGWRLGIVTAPPELIEKMALTLETGIACVPPFIQRAGIEALTGSQEEIKNMIGEFRRRRDFVVTKLNSIPNIHCTKPEGAFYAFPNIKKTGMSSEEFSKFMLDQAGVALCPGNYFGKQGEGYVRLCFANSMENIDRGIERIAYALEN